MLNNPYYEDEWVALYHGDSRAILPSLNYRVDMILTDPPYGMNRFNTDTEDFMLSVGPILSEAGKKLVAGGSLFSFMHPGEIVNLAEAVSLPFKRVLWLYKPADCTYPLHGWIMASEAIVWFLKEGKPNLIKPDEYHHDVYTHKRVGKEEGANGHPTVKPLWVVKDIIRRCPLEGLILDPFAGSGTTLVAAKQQNMKAIGIELEEEYCEIAANRLAQDVLPLWVDHDKAEIET